MKRIARIAAALALGLPGLALGATSTWQIDPGHSRAGFGVKHLVIATVKGEFGKVAGTLTLDVADVTNSKVEATIDATTIDTREPKRDEHLRSPDFFETAKYPTITFKSTKVEKAGEGKLKVTGDLTMRGVTKPVTLDVSGPTQEIKDPWGNTKRGVAATGKINRKDFRLTWSKTIEAGPVVGDEVANREWQAGGRVPAELSAVLCNPASELLRDTTRNDPIYREILLTDRQGRLIAASNVTTDYYQADDVWWPESFNDGEQGRVSVSDVRWDESARVLSLQIAVPVPDPSSERPAGVLMVVADVRVMLASVAGFEFGQTGEAVLIRPDGSIVLSRRVRDPGARFFATALLQERLQTYKKGPLQFRTTFSTSAYDGTRHIEGLATCQLSTSYPNLPWLVAVSQGDTEPP